jgi:dihydroorotate dehydrogenase (NAD+) catalytic subunit
MSKLNIEIAGIQFPNPVLVSAGTFGYGDELAEVMDINQLGGIVTKTLTLKPRLGNSAPRVIPTTGGMMNSVGLQNMGIESFIEEKLPQLKKQIQIPLIVSIMGESPEEFKSLAELLNGIEGLSAIELNLSCPNVKAGGSSFGVDPQLAGEAVNAVKKTVKLPVFAKLTPNVTDIGLIAKAVEAAGADAIVAVNTFNALSIDPETRHSRLGNWKGGLSGPAIKPLALYQVYHAVQAVKIPIIGMGGIISPADALEFILAGAMAVSIGTGNFINPRTPLKIIKGISRYLEKHHLADLHTLRGAFNPTLSA